MKSFDLNIEKILEDWETHHAIREIIANALDEQLLTKTKEIEIVKSGDSWIIRDFGRGIEYSHLTQNENQEKLSNPSVIWKVRYWTEGCSSDFQQERSDCNCKIKIR